MQIFPEKESSMKIQDKLFLVAVGVSIGLLLGGLIFLTRTAPLNEPMEIVSESSSFWRSGSLPTGIPVIGLWNVNGEIISGPCIQTDFAGIYDYSPVANPVRQLDAPDYWIDFPVRNP